MGGLICSTGHEDVLDSTTVAIKDDDRSSYSLHVDSNALKWCTPSECFHFQSVCDGDV
jgi:hypothetical protein